MKSDDLLPKHGSAISTMNIHHITHEVPEHMHPYYHTAGSSAIWKVQSTGTSMVIAMARDPFIASTIVAALNYEHRAGEE
jgi:hypothetical protein